MYLFLVVARNAEVVDFSRFEKIKLTFFDSYKEVYT